MPVEERYEAALSAAIEILRELADRPGLGRPAALSIVTFTILDAMGRLPECPCGRRVGVLRSGHRPE